MNNMITLSLTYYTAPPVIMSGPEPQTVSTSTAQDYATFTCIATGIPSPSITWTHKDIDVPPVNGSKYATFVSMMPRPNDGRIDVTNTLTIKTFDRTDSGNVICNARTSGIRTPVHASTTIAVLGMFIIVFKIKQELKTKFLL